MNIFRAGLYILSWIPVGAINFALLLIGIPLIAVLSFWPMRKWPRWTWIWQNDGDAVVWELGAMRPPHDVPRWYYEKYGPKGEGWSAYRLRFAYMAIRNPVNNHRFLFTEPESFNTSGDPAAFDTEGFDLEKRGIRSASGWRWSGFFAGYKRTWLKGPGKYSEFYIGWKVGSAVPGLGFTLQTRFNRDYIKTK